MTTVTTTTRAQAGKGSEQVSGHAAAVDDVAAGRIASHREMNVPEPREGYSLAGDMAAEPGEAETSWADPGVARFAAASAAVLLLLGGVCAFGQGGPNPVKHPVQALRAATVSPRMASASLTTYLDRVHAANSIDQPTMGSIWIDSGRFTRLTTDVRAMQPNDLISVVVVESLAASTDGTVKNTRSSTASSQLSSLFGLLHGGNSLQNLVNQSSAAGLNAQGTSATNSSLNTTFGGQVIEVLPNGMLVIEAAREVEFSQQTQTILLRGLVRPEDISQQNQVLSTAISSLELEVRGKGIINDYTRRPNALVRLLQRALIF